MLPATVVCQKCNNGFAHLDRAVIDEFDFQTFMAGVPKKKGRSPSVRSRGNVLATIEPTGATYSFNMDPIPVKAHDGSRLAAYRGLNRDVCARLSEQEVTSSITFEVPFGQNPKFIRGITKIALSSLAYFLGPTIARSTIFTAVRQLVQHGVGKRHILVMFDTGSAYCNRATPPYISPTGEYIVTFRIASAEFLVDLSEHESALPGLQLKMSEIYGENNWCVLPITV